MRPNTTKQRLAQGETVVGCWSRYADPTLAEFVACQGWDFMVFDAEHGTLDPRACENVVRATELRNATPLVRVTSNDPSVILRFLDAGAQGVQIPMVNDARDAERAVQAVKFAPRGSRGLAASRSAQFGQDLSYDEYVVDANEQTLVVVQIETPEGVAAVSSIASVEDIDVVFLGLIDLSNSFGVPGQTTHPDVQRAVQSVTDAIADSAIALGVLVGNAAAAREWRERGARYIAISLEGLISESSRRLLPSVRSAEADVKL